jgi:hypothetical protein
LYFINWISNPIHQCLRWSFSRSWIYRLRDNEPFNPERVYASGLQYYGDSSDLEIIDEYFECFIDNDELRERKITGLFLAAFNFVGELRVEIECKQR